MVGTFCSWDVLELGCFIVGKFCGLGRFLAWDILDKHLFSSIILFHFVLDRSVLWRFVLGRFIGVPKLHYAPAPAPQYCGYIKAFWS
jgi:hypothetical protein